MRNRTCSVRSHDGVSRVTILERVTTSHSLSLASLLTHTPWVLVNHQTLQRLLSRRAVPASMTNKEDEPSILIMCERLLFITTTKLRGINRIQIPCTRPTMQVPTFWREPAGQPPQPRSPTMTTAKGYKATSSTAVGIGLHDNDHGAVAVVGVSPTSIFGTTSSIQPGMVVVCALMDTTWQRLTRL